MKYFLIAGERSGDLHGSFLIKQIISRDAGAEVVCWGGDYMQQAGGLLLRHYKHTAVMGFWEVIKNLRKLARLQNACKADIVRFQPDAVIFIDYPGFNLRIAEFTKKHGFLSFYYISPKVWAWNQNRALKLKRLIDHIFCILPFEKEFFRQYGMDVSYVGNPLKEAIKSYQYDEEFLRRLAGKRVIGVLPGSREQEVTNLITLLPAMASEKPAFHFLVAGVDNLPTEMYAQVSSGSPNIEVAFGKTYEILRVSEAAIVTSGTATLEAALLNVPQVVVYKTSGVSYQIAKRLIKVPFISLVNLIAGKEVVRELIQHHFTREEILAEIENIISDASRKKNILDGYKEVDELIGEQNAAETTAAEIVTRLNPKYMTARKP